MKKFRIEKTGEVPAHILTELAKYDGQPATKQAINQLDDDIRFIVCDLGVAHGNLNKFSKDAWLSPRNADGSFNVRINFN